MAREKLSVIVFPGGFNWPIWTADTLGFFARENLDVAISYTPSSMEQLAGLIRGDWDIGMTGIDNVVAYQEGQGEAKIDREPDLFVFMGGDDAFLRLVVQGDIKSFADLKGKQLAVDALTTGFAFVLRKMIEKAGLKPSDVDYVRAGGVMQRWEALKAGNFAGTLLLTPFEIIAQSLGLRLLQSATDIYPRYQGIVGAARRGWARSHGPLLVGYIRAYLDALAWLYDRGNKAEALKILMARVPNLAAPIAEKTYGVLLADKGGFERKATLDIEGIKTVLALRSEYGEPKKALTDPRAYDDLSFYQKAIAGR